MYILILGKSGTGKSNLSDALRNAIFKVDDDCTILTDDEDRQVKKFGSGSNEYTINVARNLEKEVEEKADVIIELRTEKFLEIFRKLNS